MKGNYLSLDLLRVHGGWQSRRGNARSINCDGGVVSISRNCMVAAIFDGVGQTQPVQSYVQFWMRYFAKAALRLARFSVQMFRHFIEQGQYLGRASGYFWETLAYAAIVFDFEAHKAWAISCGDCRVGGLCSDGTIDWLTPVHTGANAFGEPFERENARLNQRHLLTKSLNTRRFCEPAILDIEISQAESAVLATDGFWLEHRLLGVAVDELEYDASIWVPHASREMRSDFIDRANFILYRCCGAG